MGIHISGPIAIHERYKEMRVKNTGTILRFSYCQAEMQEPVTSVEDVERLREVFNWVIEDCIERTVAGEPTYTPLLVRESYDIARIAFSAPWAEKEIAFGD